MVNRRRRTPVRLSLRAQLQQHALRDQLLYAIQHEDGLTSAKSEQRMEEISLRYKMLDQLLARYGVD